MNHKNTSACAEMVSPPAGSPMHQPDFLFGVATASFQIEGASTEDGRLTSIWDRFCATPGKVLHGDTGELACDHYHRWEQDIDLIASLGVDAYRFSIAWPRVMDEQGRPNQKGLDFYRRLVDRLREKGIKSMATLYHWDLPQYLEDRGGWLNRDMAYRFADYADLVSRTLGDSVAAWATFNEPWCAAYLGYGNGHHAPGYADNRFAAQAMHHLLLAHGLSLPVLRQNSPSAQVGLVANVSPGYPAQDCEADRHAVELYDANHNGWVLDPLLRGTYPSKLWQRWQGCEPLMLGGDMDVISRPMDFLGINYYTRGVVSAKGENDYQWFEVPNVPRSQMGWEVYPQGLQDIMEQFKRQYSNLPPIYITENGYSGDDKVEQGRVADSQRIAYLKEHFAACSRAMQNGVDVRGYFLWSLMDNFEWAYGYERRFGIVHVDYATQVRTLKDSAVAYADYLAGRRAGKFA